MTDPLDLEKNLRGNVDRPVRRSDAWCVPSIPTCESEAMNDAE